MGFGWDVTNAQLAQTDLGISNWRYTFTADATGSFVMDYVVAGVGNKFGLWGFYLQHDLLNGINPPAVNPFDPSGSGQFVAGVVAGQTYTASLKNGGNVAGEAITLEGSATGQFDWRLVPDQQVSVPDTGSTLALLGVAFGGLLVARRKP